ncbi:MAG: hypothetical protein L7F78_24040 [Syntrophales bacterium LBB04]|nr:hypothetical protein [Syntrophales bacterium LBB04]
MPADVAEIIKRIQKHRQGDLQGFQDIAVDLDRQPLLQNRYTRYPEKLRQDGP